MKYYASKPLAIVIFVLYFLISPFVAFADESISFSGSNDGSNALSPVADVNFKWIARKFVPSSDSIFQTVYFYGNTLSSPSGDLVVSIRASSGADVGTSDIDSVSLSSATIGSSSCGSHTVNLSASLTGGVTYWVVFSRSDFSSGYYQICDDDTLSGVGYVDFVSHGGAHNHYSFLDLEGSLDLVSPSVSTPVVIATTTAAIRGTSDMIFGLAIIVFLLSVPFWSRILGMFFGGSDLTHNTV